MTRVQTLQRHAAAFRITPGDPCAQGLHFHDWLTTACDYTSGYLLLRPEAKLCAANYVRALFHMLKHELLANLRQAPVYQSGILRGVVPKRMRDCFWVAGTLCADAERSDDTSENTWRNWVVWMNDTETVKKHVSNPKADADTFWESGKLHVLTSAPRTWSGRSRILLAPKVSEAFGEDCAMILLQFVGAERWAYTTLRRISREPFMEGPLRQLLCEPPIASRSADNSAEKPTTMFQDLLPKPRKRSLLRRLPDRLKRNVDDEQETTLLGICDSPCRLHFVKACWHRQDTSGQMPGSPLCEDEQGKASA